LSRRRKVTVTCIRTPRREAPDYKLSPNYSSVRLAYNAKQL